ncbi:YebC/PmpR family DNA-binding transcriptional regulator [Porphyromonas circumdentaria]|uniref:Probable transcriptional regulatory protein SAMN02745171_01529 n=1 Tax=Porphyromonas circumdentaria TaxID=29524 RepID=A0A1T4PN63_9PORP|nr:YebC/PmpR family DNA-binding transcriptional regulator [Porphyromonas circumdentaria]MBB6276484.1 YebC/PmpR family DNA-binding regulatory protein [Porphyromonas circumdentaria]MDO4722468.1 YebC/PmpR family DNA-binding transcriptional regulator [Porphyromonas circumdentaria]SJZ93010.1 DNA-binding regulatory protein, YebC/PmpR family [Porphyromonas circumdentaria]
MGRAFEYRKARKMKRWGNMARVFTKLGKEITMAVKAGGSDPDTNPRLRVLIQTAKKENMPKENVERAIKKATDKDFSDYKEVNYEGYGPNGIAIFVETATDNTTRTVANIRSYFNKHGGSLGTTGSLEFLFDHKCVFHLRKREDIDLEEFSLEVIDFGVEDEIEEEEGELILYGEFAQNAALQSYLEENGWEILSAEFVRIPKDYRDVTPEEAEQVNKLIEKIEEDEDVQNVFSNMRETE